MKNFCCPVCDEHLRITEGNYIFTYNINCFNNHKKMNVKIEDLLSYEKINSYNCKAHNKPKVVHCYLCNEDICLLCHKELHKDHKMEYINTIDFKDFDKQILQNSLKKEKKLIDSFLNEFLNFQETLNLHIKTFNAGLNRLLKLKENLVNYILQSKYSFPDIENVKNIIKSNYFQNIYHNFKIFTNSKTFFEKYENMKQILELLNKREQYVEEKNIIDNYNKYKKQLIIPINDKYFISTFRNSIRIDKKKLKNSTEKIYSINFEENNIIGKILKTAKKDNSFYIINYINYSHYFDNNKIKIMEMKILNLDKDDKIEVYFNTIKTLDTFIDLLVLSPNKNIIRNTNNLYLYDDLFDRKQLIYRDNDILRSFKINDNSFVFSVESLSTKKVYLIKIEDDLIEKNEIGNCAVFFLYYNINKKILFSYDYNKIYLTNFNAQFPEVMQIIEVNYESIIYNSSIKYLNNFDDDNIFFITTSNDIKYYRVTYISQYKIIKDELKEISRIEINSSNKESIY